MTTSPAQPPPVGDTATGPATATDTDTAAIFHPDTYTRGIPHAAFTRLRGQAPVVWVPEPPIDHWPAGTGFWAVLRHAETEHVLRTPQTFSSELGLTQIFDPPPAYRDLVLSSGRKQMINMDPPRHSRLRGLLTKSFTPRAVARIQDRIRARAEETVAAVADRGQCDFAQDIVAEFPLLTLADILGVPESDRWLMFDWANRVIGILDGEYSSSDKFDAAGATDMARRALEARPRPDAQGKLPDARTPAGMADLYAYARELGEYKRRHPGDDVMSVLMQQVDGDGGRVSVDEFENVFWLFSIAGNETVRNALPGGMHALLTHPEIHRRVLQDRELLPGAVEEMLRWWTPVIHFRRTAAKDVRLGGQQIREGEKVVVFFPSANRDELVFDDPDRFDITRHPNPHLSFGHGPHFCIAAQLAREQMRAMFTAVFDQLGEVAADGAPVRLRSNFQHGVKRLPIRWQSGPRRDE